MKKLIVKLHAGYCGMDAHDILIMPDDVMPFGRHQGYTVLEIIKDRPTYISWLIQNTNLKFYESVHDELFRHLKHHVPAGAGNYTWQGKPKYDWDQRGLSDFDDYFDDVPF